MKGTEFPEATTKLLPPEGQEESVYTLHVWKHPEYGIVISKWRMGWRERLHCLIHGYVWLHVWGSTHPPVTVETAYPFERGGSGLKKSLKWVGPTAILIGAVIGYFTWRHFQ